MRSSASDGGQKELVTRIVTIAMNMLRLYVMKANKMSHRIHVRGVLNKKLVPSFLLILKAHLLKLSIKIPRKFLTIFHLVCETGTSGGISISGNR